MKTIIQLEEAAITAVAIYFLTHYSSGLSVWLWVLLFFTPDISMLGYLVNTKVGALTYNLFHHRASAIVLAGFGLMVSSDVFTAMGILIFAHSSFDRMLGYGLKYRDNFKHTHLGWMGRIENQAGL